MAPVVDVWRGMEQVAQHQRERRQDEMNKDYHDMRMMAANFDIFKSKVDIMGKMMPNVTKKNYRKLYDWAIEPDENFNGVAIPAGLLVSPDDVESWNDDQFKNYKLGLQKEARKTAMDKDFEKWQYRQKLDYEKEIQKIKTQGAIKKETEIQKIKGGATAQSAIGKEAKDIAKIMGIGEDDALKMLYKDRQAARKLKEWQAEKDAIPMLVQLNPEQYALAIAELNAKYNIGQLTSSIGEEQAPIPTGRQGQGGGKRAAKTYRLENGRLVLVDDNEQIKRAKPHRRDQLR